MTPRLQPATSDTAHEAEVAEQAQIESQVTTDAPPAPVADPTPEPKTPPEVVAEQGTAVIKSVNVDEYPIHVGLAGAPKEYTFTGPDDTFEVPLAVAEQVTYVSVVEVVA